MDFALLMSVLFLVNVLFTALNLATGAHETAIGTAATAAFCAASVMLSLATPS